LYSKKGPLYGVVVPPRCRGKEKELFETGMSEIARGSSITAANKRGTEEYKRQKGGTDSYVGDRGQKKREFPLPARVQGKVKEKETKNPTEGRKKYVENGLRRGEGGIERGGKAFQFEKGGTTSRARFRGSRLALEGREKLAEAGVQEGCTGQC